MYMLLMGTKFCTFGPNWYIATAKIIIIKNSLLKCTDSLSECVVYIAIMHCIFCVMEGLKALHNSHNGNMFADSPCRH